VLIRSTFLYAINATSETVVGAFVQYSCHADFGSAYDGDTMGRGTRSEKGTGPPVTHSKTGAKHTEYTYRRARRPTRIKT
jgi:hypothetical protein